jgi:hypothetical protein
MRSAAVFFSRHSASRARRSRLATREPAPRNAAGSRRDARCIALRPRAPVSRNRHAARIVVTRRMRPIAALPRGFLPLVTH